VGRKVPYPQFAMADKLSGYRIEVGQFYFLSFFQFSGITDEKIIENPDGSLRLGFEKVSSLRLRSTIATENPQGHQAFSNALGMLPCQDCIRNQWLIFAVV
jgi:hypothetical protein